MSSATVVNLIIGLAVLALLLTRQLTTRPLRENYRLPLILGIIGIIEFINFLNGHPHGNDSRIVVAVVGSLVLAAVFGVLRALTVRVWREPGGQLLRRGNWLTAVLWIAAVAAHLGYDYLVAGRVSGSDGNAVGNATILLYLVVSLTVQRFVLLSRVTRQEAAGDVPGAP